LKRFEGRLCGGVHFSRGDTLGKREGAVTLRERDDSGEKGGKKLQKGLVESNVQDTRIGIARTNLLSTNRE